MHPTAPALICCFLLVLGWWSPSASAADGEETPKELLIRVLKECQKSPQILSVAGHTRTFQEGQARSEADFTAMLPLNGNGEKMVLAYSPLVSLRHNRPQFEDMMKTTFNGRYWMKINYSSALAGSPQSPERTIQISEACHPEFAHQYRMGFELCLPLVRFMEDGNRSFSLLQLLEGYDGYVCRVTEEKRGGTPVLKVELPPSEWIIVDPARDGVVMEHVVAGKTWRQEIQAVKVERTASGLWFATDFTYSDTIRDKEFLRYETKINNVTLVEPAALEQELRPRVGKGWKVKDERTGEEYEIQGESEEVFKKVDAVKP